MDRSVLNCPMCHERFSSRMPILVHLTKIHSIGSDQATEVGGPSQIKTRKRVNEASSGNETVVAAAEPLVDTYIDNECICCTCGRVYTDPAAMAVIKARHTKRAREESDGSLALVVYVPRSRPAKVMRNFDLNKLPPPENEEEDRS